MRKVVFGFIMGLGIAGCTSAQAACPNAATSITIPLTGTATLVVYDQNCQILPGPFVVGVPGSVLNSSTIPAVSPTLVFSANGAPSGQSGNMTITHSPSRVSMSYSYVVGAPVTSISGGTTTP